MGGAAKSLMPEDWDIISDKHNGYTYKGIKVRRIDRQHGMVELRTADDKRLSSIGLGIYEAMKKLGPKIDEVFDF